MTEEHDPILRLVQKHYPGAQLLEVEPLSTDAGGKTTHKAAGYGRPHRIRIRTEDGGEQTLVLRTATQNDFGHDRRADRAEAMILDFDTFGTIPGHVRAIDVGAFMADGKLLSLRDAGEFFVLTSYGEGTPYADDLRRIASSGECSLLDMQRCEALAVYLAELHKETPKRPSAYVRAIRDLVGHGEGIFGIADSFPPDTPACSPTRLQRIEALCLDWRWRLKASTHRLRRTHGDFHPFNILFQEGTDFTLLDASRGGVGDPADDICALAINYPFFALGHPASWEEGLQPLWRKLWSTYLAVSRDTELLNVVPPFIAWRGLVVCNPRFYPSLPARARDALLGWVEQVLANERFSPDSAGVLFQ